MHNFQFRIEELNPFQEWHLHDSADNQDYALRRAQEICRQIRRPVRILTAQNKLVAQFDPEEPNWKNQSINTTFRTHQPWKTARTEWLRRDSGSTRPLQDRKICCGGCFSADSDAPARPHKTGWSLGRSKSRRMTRNPNPGQETSDHRTNVTNWSWNTNNIDRYKYYKIWSIIENCPRQALPSSFVGLIQQG